MEKEENRDETRKQKKSKEVEPRNQERTLKNGKTNKKQPKNIKKGKRMRQKVNEQLYTFIKKRPFCSCKQC